MWREQASCANISHEIFFNPRKENLAKMICRICPVRQECSDEALERAYEEGIWGGLSRLERTSSTIEFV